MALEDVPEGRGITDIAQALNLSKSAVHRLLATFQEFGFVEQRREGRRYGLGSTLARLGLRAAEQFAPRVVARPYLEALSQTLGETVFLGVLTQAGVLIVDKVEQGQVLRVAPTLGAILPLTQTALGKLLLALSDRTAQAQLLSESRVLTPEASDEPVAFGLGQELAIIERQGYAVSLEEWIPDICCLAAPIRNRQGDVIAALAVALPCSRMPSPPRHDPFSGSGPALAYPALMAPVIETAERISAALP